MFSMRSVKVYIDIFARKFVTLVVNIETVWVSSVHNLHTMTTTMKCRTLRQRHVFNAYSTTRHIGRYVYKFFLSCHDMWWRWCVFVTYAECVYIPSIYNTLLCHLHQTLKVNYLSLKWIWLSLYRIFCALILRERRNHTVRF